MKSTMKECCDGRKISSEAKRKSDKIPRIFPTVPVIPKYQRPQSQFASFLMPIECQSSMKIFFTSTQNHFTINGGCT